MGHDFISFESAKAINGAVALIKGLPKFLRAFIPSMIRTIGILLLNLIMIPILAIYLTVYGLIFSLSGSTNKIMLAHYDALGHRLCAPLEEYLHYDAIVVLITTIIVVYVGALVINGIQTASSITSANAAMAANGMGLSASATLVSYVPLFATVILVVFIILLLRSFLTGSIAYAANV